MRLALAAYLLPVTLLALYGLLVLGLKLVSGCPPAHGPYEHCMVTGVDFAGFVNSGGRLGMVFAPIALGWLVLGGLAYALARRFRAGE
ncbi:hypothetical protein [Rhodovulum adriaticum]|uniref:Uncharacterized protein n=1 Tax=Rhodovulum adriaticum TaxID=35804 RepID=A0A4R2NJU6_RHOAD|nr:hypothetical protein [Rhodovulum adriaticum]MBK1635863.1 hypothetical protein [Rhodovulum adriaticum]TCP21404.1 hypothetical protein EV656_11155 [Rhodovulum adriaticum]